MKRFRLHPQDLLRRRWKSMHPFRQKVTRKRRWAWLTAFFLLSVLIATYSYVSDPKKLRDMAQSYLSSVLAGRVKIGEARLSIFQGLTLQDVRVFTGGENEPDTLIFSARSLRLNYNLSSLLRGQIRATQIIATQPVIRLVQNTDTLTWNYQHLLRIPHHKGASRPASSATPELPEIILRDGELENAQVHNGHYSPLGMVGFEGRLGPAPEEGRYTFTLQTRPGDASEVGPQMAGWFDPGERKAQIALRDFHFGEALRSMLPEEVRSWCEEHQLTGGLTIDSLSVDSGNQAGKPAFDVRMHLDGINMAILPEQWRSGRENQAVSQIDDNLTLLSNLGAETKDGNSLLGTVTRFTHAAPLHLHITQGSLHFNDQTGIQIEKLMGEVEGSAFAIEGNIADYSEKSPFDLRLFTPAGSPLRLGQEVNYIRSLPVPLQEVYDQFKPAGTCTFDVHIRRGGANDDVAVAGEVSILDGAFVFDHFPYPLHAVHGRLLISQNPQTGQGRLDILDIQGRGIAGTVNSDATVHIAGTVGPFNRHCEARILISGKGISSDHAVVAAMPRETQKALRLFDAPGKGQYPQFRGDFLCTVTRSQATRYHWDVDTQLDVGKAAGELVAFPYPIENMAMQLDVHDDHLDIVNAHMQKGQARLRLDGRVSWNSHKEDGSGVSMRPVITVHALNVPIDEQLIHALPEERAKWIAAAGLGGNIDLAGKVFPDATGDIAFHFGLHLHEGKLWKTQAGAPALDHLTADAQLSDTELNATKITARRGDAQINGSADINWASKTPNVQLNCAASNLALDNSLRQMLPAQAKQTWDQLQPSGTLDAQAEYRSPDDVKLVLRPRQMAVTPPALPWRMDNLTGTVKYDNGRVDLTDLSARHGGATVWLSGGGLAGIATDWKLHLRGKNVVIDPSFMLVAPKPLADLIKALDLAGSFDFDFSNLAVRDSATPQAGSDIDFAVGLQAHNASVDVGLPMDHINGACKLAGSFVAGDLADLKGDFNFDSLQVAGRPASNLSFKLIKPADQTLVTLSDLDVNIADGSLAGQMSFNVGKNASDHYTLSLVLRDADITQLDPDQKNGIQGQLSASVDLEGSWSDPSTRIGRGDVLVTGDHLYRIPILLGVSQITNLALPLNEPFTRGTAEYAVQGQNVVFSTIQLSATNMHMNGSGQMDFANKRFDLTFTTNNPRWPKLPLINDIITAAQQQLLQIHVTGTIQEPKVSAGLLSAVSTTIDKVIGK